MPLFTSELSYSDDYPTIEPSLKLDFANARALDPRITFTRASTATYVGRDGLIKTAGEDEARFDHDPTTGESKGLLIEGSGNNYFDQSQTMSNWSVSNASFETNTTETLAPDGTNTAHKLTATGSGEIQHNNIKFTGINNYNNTYFSVWLKTASGNGHFQMNTGNVVYPGNATTGYLAVYGSYVIPYPNGWYRFVVARDYGSASGGVTLGIHLNANSGDGGYGVISPQSFEQSGEALYIWAPQWEVNAQSAVPSSYIPTSGSTATRAEEQAYMTGESFSSWYNPTEGSVVTAFNPTLYVGPGDGGRAFRIYHQTISDNRIDYVVTANGGYQPYVSINGVAPSGFGGINGTPFVVGTDYKISVGFAANDYVAYKNGTQTLSSTTPASVPIADRLSLGVDLNGHIAQLTYYPKRLTNAQLQTLTQ
jgi:hypothetical protein